MLRATPRSLFTWNYAIDDADGGRHVADVDVAWVRERGRFTVDGVTYDVYRQGLMSGDFVLAAGGAIVCRASKPSAFVRSLDVEHAGRRYVLEAESAFHRAFVLRDGGGRGVGQISPVSLFTRRATIDLPTDLPPAVRVFLFWLVLILWRRASGGD